MKTNTRVYELTITKRNEEQTVRIPLPAAARRVKKVIVTTKITGANIQAPKHYFGSKAAGLSPLVTDLQSVALKSLVVALPINNVAAEHIYYARPSRIVGHPSFVINGQSVSFGNPTVISYTDIETGFTEDYNLYESIDSNYGNTILQVL